MIVVGLMSGENPTSIDVAVCEIKGAPPSLRADVLASLSIPWPQELSRLMRDAANPSQVVMNDYCLLDTAAGESFASAALEGIAHGGYYPEQIDLIGLQGQALRHEVRGDGRVVASLMVGQASIVSEWTGITTVSDFRQRDIAAGGLGAPLTAYAEWLLLRHPKKYRAVHHLGDTCTVTFLPPHSNAAQSAPEDQPLAFDTGPGMALIEYAEQHLTADSEDACRTERGTVDTAFLKQMMAHPFLDRQPPKVVGRNLFGEVYAAQMWEAAMAAGLCPANALETFVAFVVESLAHAYRRFAPGLVTEVIVGGRGRRYPHLMRRLREVMAPASVLSYEDLGMDSESMHALSVAILAYEAWHHRPCTLPTLTGVDAPTSLGSILPGQNYPKLLRQTWNR